MQCSLATASVQLQLLISQLQHVLQAPQQSVHQPPCCTEVMSSEVFESGAGLIYLWHARIDAGHHIVTLHNLQLTQKDIKEKMTCSSP